jgi:hypothetical protein
MRLAADVVSNDAVCGVVIRKFPFRIAGYLLCMGYEAAGSWGPTKSLFSRFFIKETSGR